MPTATPASSDPKIDVQVFWFKYQKAIAAVLVLATLAAIGYAGYQFYSARQNATAAALLASAKSAPDYQAVIAQYPGTPAGASAYLLLAQKQRAEKNFTASNTTLQDFTAKHPKHELVGTARLTVAANFESMGKTDDALSTYQQAAAKDPQGYQAPLALMAQVRLFKAKNRKDEARRICENVLMQYRESFWAAEAMRELRALKPDEPPQMPGRSTTALPPGVPTPPALIARPPSAPAPSAAPTAKKPK